MGQNNEKSALSTRSGRYVLQSTGYSAFIPEPLPPEPPLKIDGVLQELLSKADRALGRLDGSILTLPNPDLFVYMYMRKEAVLSSQIEGTQSSLQDILEAEAKMLDPRRPKDVGEVINYVRAMNYGLERLKELPLSVRLFREIHGKLMEGVRGSRLTPGKLRRSQNWIGPGGCTLAEATFVPPPPEEVIGLLGDLEKFLHDDSRLPLLVNIGLAHAQFETIHPFLDGNGRIGRLLITFLLCERQVLSKPVLYLSYYLKKHRMEYYEGLQGIRERGAWEDWLVFFLAGIVEVSDQATETARTIIALRETDQRIITVEFGRAAGNGHKVLEMLYRVPIVSVHDIRSLICTSYPTANDLVQRFVETGILSEITDRKRNRRFMYRKYVNLFTGA